jgi:hypothetical protein
MKYFNQFPEVIYNDYNIRDIIKKVSIDDLIAQEGSKGLEFMPYTLGENDKPWTVANDYYNDPERVWIVLLCNNIIDPYYDWYINQNDFASYIAKKYGSVEAAQANLEYYVDADGTQYSKDSYTYNETPIAGDGRVNKTAWTPKYSYAIEDEANEAKRSIKLLNRIYAGQAEKNLKELLNG